MNEHVCTGGSKAKVAEEALRLDDFEDVKLMLNDRLERAEKSDGQSAAGSESVRRAGSSSQRGEGNMIDDTVQQLGVEAQLRFLKAKSRVLQEELEKQVIINHIFCTATLFTGIFIRMLRNYLFFRVLCFST